MTPHEEKMLERGWIAVRDLSGAIVEWRDPTEPRNVWSDQEAYLFWQAGDCGSVPPLRRAGRLEEAHES